jgi:hypothetical protein
MRQPWVALAVLAVLAVVVLVAWRRRGAWQLWRLWAGRRAAAAPPARKPAASDQTLADAINAVNADMRSLELGRWYVAQLRKRATGACAAPAAADKACAQIADLVPGANEVTRREVRGHLGDLLDLACADAAASGESVDTVLARYGQSAFGLPGGAPGLLAGMPGYAQRSPRALPKV